METRTVPDSDLDDKRAKLADALDPRTLRLSIMPTEKCNFRCVYCYEDFAIGKMSARTIHAVKSLLRNRAPHLKTLQLTWFGGEPLAAKEICLDIAQYAHELAAAHSVAFSGSVTTNGWLLDLPLLRRLAAVRQHAFQITLDGDAEAHDTTRLQADGKGTFERIWANLHAMAGTNIPFSATLRLHITARNLRSLERLVAMLNEDFGGDSRYSVLFHSVSDLGGPNSGAFDVLPRDEYRKRVADLTSLCRLPTMSDVQALATGSVCYAAKANSLIIRANGRVAKCTVAFTDERNDVGYLQDDGTLKLDADKIRGWMRGFEDFDPGTLTCPLSTLSERMKRSFKSIPIASST